MSTSQRHQEIKALEHAFWQSIVDGNPKVATDMLTEPALMVSGHGANSFDHAGYEQMARDERFKLLRFELSAMEVTFPREDVAVATYHVDQSLEMEGKHVELESYDSSTWVKIGDDWKCVAHTESAAAAAKE